MPLQAVFDAVIESTNPGADDALVAALAEAEPEAVGPIARSLIRRNRPAGLMGLVAHYHKLGDEVQREVRGTIGDLFGVLRAACADETPQVRLNVVAIIAACCEYRLAYLLSALLRDRAPRVRKAAAEALRKLVELYPTEPDDGAQATDSAASRPEDPTAQQTAIPDHRDRRRHLAEAVLSGLQSFERHLHPPVVEAAMCMVDELDASFWPILRSAGGHARRAALDIVERSSSPRLVPFAVEALAYEEFRATIVRILSAPMSDQALLEWARQSWRLEIEALRRPMRLVRQWPSLVEAVGRPNAWGPADRRRLVRLIGHTNLAVETKVALLRRLASYGDPVGRRAAVWGLCDLDCPASSMALRAIVDSVDAALVPIIKRELRRRLAQEMAAQQAATEDGGEPVVPAELERYWSEFETLEPAEQARGGAAVLLRPENAQAFLKHKLSSRSVSVRVKALQILTVTNQAAAFEQAVYALAHDADSVVRSAVMTALGRIPTATSELLLRSALRDPDSRVQANAIDSLDRLSATAGEPLVHEKLRDENGRTRANAIKALLKLRVRDAAESLCAMLRDTDPEQRRSALWVVGEMRLVPLVARIVDLARSDPDPLVRRRARSVLTGLDPSCNVGATAATPQEVLRSVS